MCSRESISRHLFDGVERVRGINVKCNLKPEQKETRVNRHVLLPFPIPVRTTEYFGIIYCHLFFPRIPASEVLGKTGYDFASFQYSQFITTVFVLSSSAVKFTY